MADQPTQPLLETPIAAAHRQAGARMVAFAGYAMPIQYPAGILAEHAWTREHAGLFDVSHMGQAVLAGPDHETTARALETLVPGDILGLAPGQQRYTQLLNEEGGILDDLIVGRPADPAREGELTLVVNAATKETDYRHVAASLPAGVALRQLDGGALIALQGPDAARVLGALVPGIDALGFMRAVEGVVDGTPVTISRSGYTGEDGFEISLAAEAALRLWKRLLGDPSVRPVGLGARDSLRLEAGLPLYGHDINQETSPVEAALGWSIARRRRREGGFPGQIRILQELESGPLRRRVGLVVEGRNPAREHGDILDAAGELVGKVTSGGFAPSLGGPIAMGYVVADLGRPGTALAVRIRERTVPSRVTAMPFWPHRYKR